MSPGAAGTLLPSLATSPVGRPSLQDNGTHGRPSTPGQEHTFLRNTELQTASNAPSEVLVLPQVDTSVERET